MTCLIAIFHQSANISYMFLLGPVVTTNYLEVDDMQKADRLLEQEFDEDGIVMRRFRQ